MERLDVVDSPIADDVLTAFLNARTDIVNSIKFEGTYDDENGRFYSCDIDGHLIPYHIEQFWENLSTESAFMAKVFIKFLKSQKVGHLKRGMILGSRAA